MAAAAADIGPSLERSGTPANDVRKRRHALNDPAPRLSDGLLLALAKHELPKVSPPSSSPVQVRAHWSPWRESDAPPCMDANEDDASGQPAVGDGAQALRSIVLSM